jgi:hypothetical protein|nr:hypothetical protein [uncultured Oscillibacter sp.]
MELEWEQGRQPAHTAAALAGAFLGAALGADCFLAADHLIGGIPAVLCGAAIGFWAVKGGGLLAGKNNQFVTLLALIPALLWGVLVNHLSFALNTAPADPAGVWEAFISPLFISDGVNYWFQLAKLLAVVLGAWTPQFREAKKEQEFLEQASRPCKPPQETPPADMEIYLPKYAWIRPWLLQRRITQGLWLAVLFLLVWLPDLLGHERIWFRTLCGMGVSFLVIASLPGPSGHILAARKVMYARKDGQLWLIAMQRIHDTTLHVRFPKLAQIWDQLPQTQRTRFKASIASLLSKENNIAVKINRPMLEYQNKWRWVISNDVGRKAYIPKVYPQFSPVPGDTEQLKEAVPVWWRNPLMTLVITVFCLTVGIHIGLEEERQAALLPPEPPSVESVVPDPEDSTPVTKAIAPEVIGDYYLNGLILRTDDAFQASTTQLEDQENGLTYQISLQYGVGEEAAQISLGKTQGENVRCLRPDSEEFLWGMGDNGVTYRYNLRTVQLPHNQTAHTGAALSERGTLIIIECVHDDDAEEELARGTLLYMLENLQFTGPAITEENYQEQLRPAVNMGFNYCGQAFFKAPEGMFEYDVFLDTFMPCGGKMNYYDGGISMMTKAHGLRVSAAIVPSEGTAMDVVEQAYQDLKTAGRQYDEQTLFQDAYNEEGNNACRLTVYYDGGRTRVTVLVAIEEREGCYLFKEMTCLPEEVDSEYQAVFKEMEATCGIEVSVMEDLGRHSQ